jgi:hypothetical protein
MLDGLPTDGSPLDPKQVDELQSQIEDLMAKLAGNPDLRPEDCTPDTLREMGLGDKVTYQLIMLKTLYDDLASGKPVDVEKLKDGLAAVLKDLEKDFQLEIDEAGKFEEANTKLKAVDALQQFEKGLPADSQTTIDQNTELANLVENIAKDLAKDPSLDLSSVTKDDLRALGLAPSTIDEVMALQDLFIDASSGVSLPVNDLISKIDDLKDKLTADADQDIKDAEVLKTDDPIEHGLHGVDKLKKLREALPSSGPLDDDQKYAVKVTVEEVIKELAGDPLFDPKSATEDSLRATYPNLDDKTVDEILDLKKIYDDVSDPKAEVDAEALHRQLDDVVGSMLRDAIMKKSQREIQKLEDDVEGKKGAVDLISDIQRGLPASGPVPAKIKDKLKSQIEDLIKKISADPNLTPQDCTPTNLNHKDLPESSKEQLTKLKDLHDQLSSPHPVDAGQLAKDLDKILSSLRNEIEAEKAHVAKFQDAANKLRNVEDLKDFEKSLRETGATTLPQNDALAAIIQNIVADLAKDADFGEKFDLANYDEDELMARRLGPSTIAEIEQLKTLFD